MARPDWVEEFEALEKPEVLDALVRMLGESHFLWEDYLHAQPENVLHMICDPAEWTRHPGEKQLAVDLASALASTDTFERRAVAVRRFRDREVFRADLRSILGLSRGQEEFSTELAAVAEALLRAAYDLAVREAASRHFQGDMTRIPPSALFALGKFGGRELGFASDLEVMIVYDDRARSRAGSANGSSGFFDSAVAACGAFWEAGRGTRSSSISVSVRTAGRALRHVHLYLSRVLSCRRVGLGLRAPGFDQAPQDRRRLRWLARYRTTATGSSMGRNRSISRACGECAAPDRAAHHARHGECEVQPGALVDVEYVVQALQIAHGTQCVALRSPNTLEALAALGAAGCLDLVKMATLRSSYRFFRLLIDALRVVPTTPRT